MKTFFAKLKKDEGFTLVELMVVVAIIGVLSAVAIPNFKKYQAKSKASEAKLQLSSLYTAESAFYADYNIYHICLDVMGFNPTAEAPSRYFAVGFGTITAAINANNYASAQTSGLDATTCAANLASAAGTSGRTWFPAGKASAGTIATTINYLDNTAIGTQENAGSSTFTAAASGNISSDAAFVTESTSALITINNAKVIGTPRQGY